MKQITIVAFRGIGFRRSKYKTEPALVRAGHIGVIFEGEPTKIYGFHPSSEAVDNAGGIEQLIDLLKRHKRQPGTVQDDTSVFHRAHELAQQGELNRRTEVYQLVYELDDDIYQEAYNAMLDLYQSQKTIWYNFPYEDGTFEDNEYNCAVFPKHMGIPIPSENGLVNKYIEAMQEQGAQIWSRQ